MFGFGGQPVDLDAARAAAGEIEDTLGLLDTLVAGETVLGTLTIADFAIAPVLFRTTHLPMALEPFGRLARLRESLTRRPSFAAADPVR